LEPPQLLFKDRAAGDRRWNPSLTRSFGPKMADPASVIGILGVCLQVSKEIVKYSQDFKNAPRDAAELITEVVAIQHVLEPLRTHLKKASLRGNTFERTSVLFFAVNGCRKRLEDIHQVLNGFVSNNKIWNRLVWPFERTETKDAVLALHRFAQIFHFALNLDGL